MFLLIGILFVLAVSGQSFSVVGGYWMSVMQGLYINSLFEFSLMVFYKAFLMFNSIYSVHMLPQVRGSCTWPLYIMYKSV